MRTIRSCRAVLFLILLAATPLLAQERCEPAETIATCLDRQKDSYLKHVNAQEWNDLKSQPTGVDTGGANVGTNKNDFNPLMALAGLLGTSTDGTDGAEGTMLLNFNVPLPIHNPKNANNAQIQVLANTQPQLSALVRDAIQGNNAIPADQRDDRVSRLEEQIADLADYTIRFTYNHTSDSLGRSFEQHATKFGNLCSTALEREVKRRMGDDVMTKLAGQTAHDLAVATVTSDTPFKDMDPEVAFRAFQQVDEKTSQLWDLWDQSLGAVGIEEYDELLDNQPQLNITAKKTFRDPLVGPDELSVKVTYEMSRLNLNAATEGCDSEWKTPDCVEKYEQYVKKWQNKIKGGNRFSFSGEYVEADGETIDTGFSDINPLVSEDARKLVLSLGWGRKLNLGGGEPVQLDLQGSYEDVSDDPLRQDRGILRLTFTRNVGEMSIPFGIVYANHGEFLVDEDVDARLSAHIGLKFNMSGGSGGQ